MQALTWLRATGLRWAGAVAICAVAWFDAWSCEPFTANPTPDGGDGSAQDAGAETDASGAERCNGATRRGSLMIETDRAAPFCVDATEVTLAQYRAFYVDKAPRDYGDAAALCGAADLQPSGGLDVSPVEVTYCGARAYCAWAGKRLCTGEFRPASDQDIVGEWTRACSRGGAPWPWGSEAPGNFDAGSDAGRPRCGDRHNQRPVGQSEACRHGDLPIFDMIGNAREWIVATGEFNEATGVFYAAMRGESEVAYWQPCSFAGLRAHQNTRAGQSSPRAGFRCCADVLSR